jgi:hypothetical protein
MGQSEIHEEATNAQKGESNSDYTYIHPETLKVILQVLQKEYEMEYDRSKTIDTRCGTLLAFCGVGLVALTKFTDLNELYNKPVIGIRLIILSSLLAMLLLVSVTCFINVLRLRKYSCLNEMQISSESSINDEESVVIDKIICNYASFTRENRKTTNI